MVGRLNPNMLMKNFIRGCIFDSSPEAKGRAGKARAGAWEEEGKNIEGGQRWKPPSLKNR